MNDKLRVLRIIDGTTVDGPGFRTSIYFAGCGHRCPGCHNPQSWDFDGGVPMSIDELMERIEANDMNVTFSGGDPIYQLEPLTRLARRIKASGRTIWCYTGFTIEQLKANNAAEELLTHVDVLVDGRYEQTLRDTELLFRGSSNQRLIDLPKTLSNSEVILWESVF